VASSVVSFSHRRQPIDDVEAIYRISWDARMKFQQMYPDRFEVYFFNAPVRKLGQVITQ